MLSILLSALALASPAPIQEPPSQAPPAKNEENAKPAPPKTVWEYLAAKYDANKDGKIEKDEYSRGKEQFLRLDKDKNGLIEEADTKTRGPRQRGRGERPKVNPPQEGAVAPDFILQTLYPIKTKAKDAAKPKQDGTDKKKGDVRDSKEKSSTPKDDSKPAQAEKFESIKLSSFKGKKPVALIFGSYT